MNRGILRGLTNATARFNPGTPTVELDYAQFTTTVSPTATTEAGADVVVTGNAVSYDGTTTVAIEFVAGTLRPAAVLGAILRLWLFQDGASIGRLATFTGESTSGGGSVGAYTACHAVRRLTPTAGSHTYSVRADVSTGTASIEAGAGGAGNNVPGFIRISRVV